MLFDQAAREVAERYRRRPAHYYVRSKLQLDPVSRALHDLGATEPYGSVVDVACGRGQVGLLLRATGMAGPVVGYDWDAAKIALASDAARDLPDVRFVHADVREVAIPAADTVLLVDVLHYLTPEEQDDLLLRAARAARRSVIVREVDPDRGPSSAFTRAWEWVTTTLRYNRGARVAPRSIEAITSALRAEGLDVSSSPCSARGMSNVLVVGRRVRETK